MMNHLINCQSSKSPSYRQSGVSLLVALIALAAMSIAGIALIRSMDTNALIAGNLAFRQNATTSADTGAELARTWLMSKSSADLQNSLDGEGYYATRADTGGEDGRGMDITGSRTQSSNDNIKWIDAKGVEQPGNFPARCQAANDGAGNRVCYVIHRMCGAPGDLASSNCSLTTSNDSGGDSLGGLGRQMTYQGTLTGTGAMMGYYRISVRVSGPRNNNSYVQVFVQR